MRSLRVCCPSCEHQFDVSQSLARGFANCPHCAKACPVAGGWEPLFKLLMAALIAGSLVLTLLAFSQLGLVAGGLMFGLGLMVILVTLASS